MTEAEKEVILHQWSNTTSTYPREAGIAALFENTAMQFNNKIAIKDQATSLTYDQLNQLANFIAHKLISKGVEKGDIVAVSIERSWQFVTTILGILKSGAAYLPLDPQYPSKRTEFILKDAQAKLLITQHHHNSKLSQLSDIEIVIFEDIWEEYKHQHQRFDTPQVSVKGDDLAYIMYTSGSTGEPKGTLIPQRGISRLVLNTNYLSITPQDIIGCESNPAFDAITFEIFGALLNGAQLTIIDHDTLVNTAQLGAFLAREKITILWQTAALFNHHVAEDASIYKSLRALLFGGEAATPKWVKKLCDTYNPPLLINGYGPTENTTFTTT
jgi:non-ribosomal peptide synthetase component F